MSDATPTFEELGLKPSLLKALGDIGYETPSPIQAQSLPPLLEGRDILGQAQTGTGKTAAFALPILQQIDLSQKSPQVLVLAPTRELAIQVAEAFQSYARYIKGFHILPVYGGQGYDGQIRALKRGVHVVVGTPGRVMDHMRKGTLKLDQLKHLVLDEADEMLRMGFIDDVEWVMSHTPDDRQIALFSATMPREIEKVAKTYLQEPVHVQIKVQTTTAETIRQRYWQVGGLNKLDALTRILEAENFDAIIMFVRTKTATVELAEKLEARGYSSAALNGDISQQLRERTVDKLKKGQIDILIATDVAARGLDVERISHVINYDIPYDTEAYVHRIGRTGRAGRSGEAILFVARREHRMLRQIERATNTQIEEMQLPSTDLINEQRVQRFKQSISDTLSNDDIEFFKQLVADFQQETEISALDIAAALAKLSQGEQPFLLEEPPEPKRRERKERSERGERGERRDRKERSSRGNDADMQTYRIEVGRRDGVSPGNIVGAIANEADIDSSYIGHIKLFDNFSLVDLPKGMPDETFQLLQKARVCNRIMRISLDEGPGSGSDRGKHNKGKKFDKAGKSKKFKARS
ncbi:DEAD/DEAH box helicase [Agaribacterium haliotis]|uniref:DEAD/DEAH box helicase n=1 Tax=Agaribacterium haliotis TaxID=2013869 RepID=UPI000BB55F01|nr:DEAD/DEAH box helicase [Agaribacterium haliotis]